MRDLTSVEVDCGYCHKRNEVYVDIGIGQDSALCQHCGKLFLIDISVMDGEAVAYGAEMHADYVSDDRGTHGA